MNARAAPTSKPKSLARQNAGKIKAASFTSWTNDFKAAREALKQEGYKGSLKLKKGMPMYEKIQEIKKQRVAQASAASGVPSASVPACS